MPATTFDRFDKGMDLRRGAGVQDANAVILLKNAHVSTGWTLQKRPGTTLVANLEAGTVGLKAGNGKLNTFQGHGAAVSHANTLFQANRIAHPSASGVLPSRVRAAQVFNGFLYVAAEYDNADVYHSYLDTDSEWSAAAVKTVGDFVQPVTVNGYRYECTASGTTGATEPNWPTTVAGTVVDNGVTWTCRAKVITDANCPHSESFTVLSSKVWTPGAEVVRYCATNAPRDWTTADDAGFLPTGVQALGSADSTGVGRFRKKLAVAHDDAIQTWDVDPDPANNSFDELLEVGTELPHTLENLGQDLFVLSPFGFRALSLLQNVDGSLSDIDTGGPVDDPVSTDVSAITDTFAPQTIFYRGGGQLWTHVGSGKVWVYTYSRFSKVKAWSYYEFPFDIDDMAELNNVLYLRSGDAVYKVDTAVYTDAGANYEVDVLTPFIAMKKSGQLKQFIGMDGVMKGAAAVSFLWDPDDLTAETTGYNVEGDTRKDGMVPVECTATELAVRFVNSDANDWRLDLFSLYYDILGPM